MTSSRINAQAWSSSREAAALIKPWFDGRAGPAPPPVAEGRPQPLAAVRTNSRVARYDWFQFGRQPPSERRRGAVEKGRESSCDLLTLRLTSPSPGGIARLERGDRRLARRSA